MIPVDYLVGQAVGVGTLLVVRVATRRRTPKLERPYCGCNHHISMHDPVTNECHARHYLSSTGKHHQCTCRRYVGPVPAEMMVAAFRSPREIDTV